MLSRPACVCSLKCKPFCVDVIRSCIGWDLPRAGGVDLDRYKSTEAESIYATEAGLHFFSSSTLKAAIVWRHSVYLWLPT